MPLIRITGWDPGLKKVSLTQLLRAYTDMSLSEAKAATDRILDGADFEFLVRTSADAIRVSAELRALGVRIEMREDSVVPPNAFLPQRPDGIG